MTLLVVARKMLDRLVPVFVTIAGALTIAMMLLIVIEVGLRTFGGPSPNLSGEMGGYMLVALTFFAAAFSLRRAGFIRVTFLYERMPPLSRRLAQTLYDLMSLAYMLVLTYSGYTLTMSSYRSGIVSNQPSGTAIYIPQAIMVIGMGVVILAVITELILDLESLVHPDSDRTATGSRQESTPEAETDLLSKGV